MREHMQKISAFITEARQELRRIEWPTRRETARLTGIVIGLSFLMAIFLGFFDYVFSFLLTQLLLFVK
ncbi:MAG: preprotein translocase subunit SecE [Candidatus Liptonbacteria bacterium]|nr:preprotein translocase subunit SecE [Candidatus Liptonbacteria bacterium]